MLSEVRQKERQILYAITYMQNPKYGTNELICKTQTDSQTWKQTCGCQEGGKVIYKQGVWG